MAGLAHAGRLLAKSNHIGTRSGLLTLRGCWRVRGCSMLPRTTFLPTKPSRLRKITSSSFCLPAHVPFLLHPFVSLYTTRGCPAQCTFCLWPQTLSGHPWRKRSSDDVAREMAKAKEYWPYVKEFFFDDDTFNIQKARTIELCSKLKPLNLTWSCTSRVTTDYETLKAMKEAGCRLLIVGYESGDQQILKNIKKGATIERARQ